MSSTTNKTPATDKQLDADTYLSPRTPAANTQNWKETKKLFLPHIYQNVAGESMEGSTAPTEANKGTVTEKVPVLAAPEKTGVPMVASKEPTEPKKDTKAKMFGRCHKFGKRGERFPGLHESILP